MTDSLVLSANRSFKTMRLFLQIHECVLKKKVKQPKKLSSTTNTHTRVRVYILYTESIKISWFTKFQTEKKNNKFNKIYTWYTQRAPLKLFFFKSPHLKLFNGVYSLIKFHSLVASTCIPPQIIANTIFIIQEKYIKKK